MRTIHGLIVSLALVLALAGVTTANLIDNGGFEEPYTNGWNSWNEGSIIQPMDWGWAHSGTGMVGMWWDAGLWQDHTVTPGSNYALTSYAYLPSDDPAGTGVYGVVAMEWRDSGGQFISSWTSAPIDTAHYSVDQWLAITSGVQTAPAGAATLRTLVRINNDGSGAGRVYYDDVEVNGMIPEPAAGILLISGMAGIVAWRRRRNG